MQTSNTQEKSWFGILFALLLVAVGTIWFMQQSINAYWQQTYHQNSPLVQLDSYSWWHRGADLHNITKDYYQKMNDRIGHFSDQWLRYWHKEILTAGPEANIENTKTEKIKTATTKAEATKAEAADTEKTKDTDNITSVQPIIVLESLKPDENTPVETVAKTKTAEAKMDIVVAAEAQQEGKTVDHKADSKTTTQTEENGTADKQTEKATQVKSGKTTEAVTEKTVGETSQETSEEKSDANPDNITLSAGDRVFFAGDSLMQGVAPHMRKWLKSRYQINSIDLSKQSTGLSYPSFFNWPETIEKQLVKDSHIKLLIVFLGPNDPWAFPNPDKKGGTYLKFKSDGWERVYRQRVDRIVQAARKSKAKLIWLGIPYMKKRKLNRQMRYLDKLLADELKGKVLWLPTAKLLSGGRDRYHASAKVNGKNVRMRSKDGIHFTISGQKQIAKYIMEHINFNQSE